TVECANDFQVGTPLRAVRLINQLGQNRSSNSVIMRFWNPMMWRTFALVFCFVWLSSAVAEEHDHPAPEKLGKVNFPASCSAATQKEFERAVALLHSFAYSAAEKAFRELIEKDPNCAMAHWGLAMSYVHPLWEPYLTPTDAARGRAEIERAKSLKCSE